MAEWTGHKAKYEILELIRKYGPITTARLAQLTGKKNAAAGFQVRELYRAEPKLIYIADYEFGGGRGKNGAMWAVGGLEDMPRPMPDKTKPTLMSARQKEEWDEAVAAAEDARARRRALAECKVQRDPFIAQFFGSHA